jgi:hypothetical protein
VTEALPDPLVPEFEAEKIAQLMQLMDESDATALAHGKVA